MDAPTPTIETVENAYEHVTEQIAALQAHKPQTQAEHRRRATEMAALKQTQLNLAKQVINENAAQRIAEAIGEDHAKPMNGSNGHAPINQPNWAQVIAETELRCERQIATLKEAKSSGLNASDLTALAQGLVPYLNERLDEVVAPLQARIDELEARPSLLYEGVFSEEKTYAPGSFCTFGGGLWFCENGCAAGDRPGAGSSNWRLAVKRGRAER